MQNRLHSARRRPSHPRTFGAPPRRRHRLTDRLFLRQVETHFRAARAAPRTGLRREHVRLRPNERALLVRCELDHSEPHVGVERREDATVGAEVGMPHVRAFDGLVKVECDSPKVLGRHVLTQPAVSMIGRCRVTTSVCSWCAERLPSLVRIVQPSGSSRIRSDPALMIGSMVSTRPSVNTSRCHGS